VQPGYLLEEEAAKKYAYEVMFKLFKTDYTHHPMVFWMQDYVI
jgi:hypothetical protein